MKRNNGISNKHMGSASGPMDEKKMNRRDFFKATGKAIIPSLGIIGLSLGFSRIAQAGSGCNNDCYGSCLDSCAQACSYGCQGGCSGDCKGLCGGCDGTCKNGLMTN